ncbi:MAG: thiamine pyrophosphate-binding protein [Thermoplasmata archaeon]|nr:thiamine pyrophosphate-binding protein [Euryarchaeota archaeon]MVT36324.1 thiamine pyrophosphate-binding protein [Euryarchaeota archaeon]
MKGNEVFRKSIEKLGLFPVFGNPGSTEVGLLRGIEKYILTLHDSISVGMADGLTQYSGIPRMVNLHDLPGLANSMAFIYTAKINRSPIIITAGQQDTRHMVYDPLLYWDLTSVVADSVKFKYEIKNPDDIPIALKKAKMQALTPPMGPVFISIPENFMDYDVNYYEFKDHIVPSSLVDIDSIEQIAERIMNAKNPAIVFGFEIDIYDAFKEAEQFASALGCPVYGEPLSSRAPFISEDPHYAGDLLPGSTLINMKLLQHDLILFVGADITLYPYLPSPILPGKELIFVGLNINPKIGDFYFMNPKAFLSEILRKINKKCNFKREKDLSLAGKIARERASMGLNFVLYNVKRRFPEHIIVDESISASTTLRYIFGYSRRRYFTARSGQLGWATPAALGISMESNNVLAVEGDGSFMYTVQALWTAKRYNLPAKFIVLRNDAYSILRSYAKSYYPEMEDFPGFLFHLDIEKIASSFGIESETATGDLKELDWLVEGNIAKVLVIDIDRSVQKLFL